MFQAQAPFGVLEQLSDERTVVPVLNHTLVRLEHPRMVRDVIGVEFFWKVVYHCPHDIHVIVVESNHLIYSFFLFLDGLAERTVRWGEAALVIGPTIERWNQLNLCCWIRNASSGYFGGGVEGGGEHS